MPAIACLILLAALAAPAAAPAQPAASEPVLLAQTEETEEQPTPPAEEEDEAAETDEDEAEPTDAEAAQEAEAAEQEAEAAEEGQEQREAEEEAAEEEIAEDEAILRSPSDMPEPVRETWRALRDAARSGDIERLRPIIEDQAEPPMVAFNDVGEPIAYLRSLSGDPEGWEVLAILLEVLEMGFLHVDPGTEQEMYLWPYFARYPVEELTQRQMVELFTLLNAGDYQDMLSFGTYIFFRVGIAPDGRWLFFLAGH